ncbi:ankyrin repeat domain-containing protein [Flagellimonas aquimarina]|uniref:Ankyrin repeat domain-containing protein n=1 Tax=Flagellimonas aquimarina TaxID=2201895 RepID=A0A316L0Q2_9FLAO|nr:ankyrin repeat domain-containing protein [Allomuricauda koreensis]PWL37733.1 ankyrin repeat domain-containing protein [Allomuricauda koreensis]
MKKTILTVTAACMLAVTGVCANETTSTFEADLHPATISVEINSFCKAIVKGDVETVKKLIELGEDVNQKSLGMAPIHFAARYNQTEILELLIANGANVKKRCDKGYTAKKYAELSNAVEAMEILKLAMKK